MDLSKILDSYRSPDKAQSLKSALSKVDDLPALLKAAQDRSKELKELKDKGEKLTKDQVEEMRDLSQVITAAVDEHNSQLEQAEIDAEAETLFEQLQSQKLAEPKPKAEEKKEDPAPEAKAEVKPEPVAEKPAEPAAPVVEQPKVEAAPVSQVNEPAPELVGAGATQFSASQLPSQGSVPPVVTRPSGTFSQVFAASPSGVSTGERITTAKELADQWREVYKSYPTHTRGNGIKHRVATYKRTEKEEFSASENMTDQQMIDYVADMKPEWDETAGQFAAGWCAPEETIYELCPQLSTSTGLVDMPTRVARRGSVQFTKGPRFSTLYADAAVGNVLTETQVEAETEKVCIEIDCPDFTTLTLDVNPLCITGNLLTHAGYPEYEQRFISEVIAANEHKINANVIARMVAASTAINLTTATTGAVDTSSMTRFLDAASKYATWLRGSERTDLDKIVRVEAPYWIWQQMSSDVSRRNGVDMLTARRRFNEAAAERGLDVRFLYDWQMLNANPADATVINGPLTATILVYFPGTFVKFVNPVINLGVMHSAAQLTLNQYTAMFVEDGFAVAERCWDSLAVTFGTCPSGTTGAASGSCDVTP